MNPRKAKAGPKLEICDLRYPCLLQGRQPSSPSPEATLQALKAEETQLDTQVTTASVNSFLLRTELLRSLQTAKDMFDLHSIN